MTVNSDKNPDKVSGFGCCQPQADFGIADHVK